MALYIEAKRLQTSRNDMNDIILRPGELHIVMAMLRSIGKYIEDSGIDQCWIESGLYGPNTVKQILNGNHVKRGIKAHLITLQSLFHLYQDAFFETQKDLKDELNDTISTAIEKSVQLTKIDHDTVISAIKSSCVMEKMKKFDDDTKCTLIFSCMRYEYYKERKII